MRSRRLRQRGDPEARILRNLLRERLRPSRSVVLITVTVHSIPQRHDAVVECTVTVIRAAEPRPQQNDHTMPLLRRRRSITQKNHDAVRLMRPTSYRARIVVE